MAADMTKCELSSLAATVLTYHHAAVDVDARVTRGRFETLIAPMLSPATARKVYQGSVVQ